MDIIDFHVHTGYDFHADEHGVLIDNEKFRSDLEACGVTKCCGSYLPKACNGRPVADYEQYIPELNAKAYETKELYGDFYIPGLHIHPAFVEMSCREIEKYARLGVKMIGELVPYMMGWQGCATKEFLEIMDCAASYNMVVNIHLTSGADMRALCASIPKSITLVWAHFSAFGTFDEHTGLLREFENVYFDTSAHGSDRVGIIKDAVNAVGSEKLLFGTDYPGIGPASDIGAMMVEDISEADRENIFSLNAKRLLKLQ